MIIQLRERAIRKLQSWFVANRSGSGEQVKVRSDDYIVARISNNPTKTSDYKHVYVASFSIIVSPIIVIVFRALTHSMKTCFVWRSND